MTWIGPSHPLNNQAEIGPYHWPPRNGEGGIRVKVKTAIEVDTQKPNGKDPVKSKLKGKKVAELELTFSFTRQVETEGDAIRIALDPNGENSGKPLDIINPEPNKRGVRSILVKTASDLTVNGDLFSFTLTADGWAEEKKGSVGGTVTPKTSAPVQHMRSPHNAGKALGEIQPGGPRLPSVTGEIPKTGLDNPAKKPSAEPD